MAVKTQVKTQKVTLNIEAARESRKTGVRGAIKSYKDIDRASFSFMKKNSITEDNVIAFHKAIINNWAFANMSSDKFTPQDALNKLLDAEEALAEREE